MSRFFKKISVVVPTYNRAELLGYTLTSLARQTLARKHFEVIVVDDGGKDESGQVVERFQDRLDIKYVSQEDHGFTVGKARNIGVSLAWGELVVFCDTGILLSSQALELRLKAHKRSRFPCVVIGYVHAFEITDEQVDRLLPLIDPEDTDRCIEVAKAQEAFDVREPQYRALGEDVHAWPAPFDIFWTCHVSAPRNEIIRSGESDPSYSSWGGEDVDLAIRLFMNNHVFYFDRNICSFHWPHKKQVADVKEKSAKAAMKLHRRYKLWQTSFYKYMEMDDLHAKFSLNMAIKCIGPVETEEGLEKFRNWK